MKTPSRSQSHASAKDAGGAIRTTAVLLTLVGVIIMLVAVFADSLGIGGGRGFGWKQLIVAILGLVMVLIGIAWFLQPPATPLSDDLEDADEPPPSDGTSQDRP